MDGGAGVTEGVETVPPVLPVPPVPPPGPVGGASGNEADDEGEVTMAELRAAMEEMDGELDSALGNAADKVWSFATGVTGRVSSAVRDGQGLEVLRRGVAEGLEGVGKGLEGVGGAVSGGIGGVVKEDALRNFTGGLRDVVGTVQRNAEAMEAAILAKANARPAEGASEKRAVQEADLGSAMPSLPFADGVAGVDVNAELSKVGEKLSNSLVGQTVGGLWGDLWGDDDDEEEESGDAVLQAQVPMNRFEQRVFELQANPDTYCEPAKDLDAFEAWSATFSLDENEEACIALLDRHSSIAELYERVVPRIVEEETFWMRYFFANHVLEVEEERRRKLLERAENAVGGSDNEEDWGDDDWDDDDAPEEDSSAQATGGDESTAAEGNGTAKRDTEQSTLGVDDAVDASGEKYLKAAVPPGSEKAAADAPPAMQGGTDSAKQTDASQQPDQGGGSGLLNSAGAPDDGRDGQGATCSKQTKDEDGNEAAWSDDDWE